MKQAGVAPWYRIVLYVLAISMPTSVWASFKDEVSGLYQSLNLAGEVSYQAFADAYRHFAHNRSRKPVMTLIDYGKPSSEKRFWVINVKKRQVLFRSYVSHGKNSGSLYAKRFSNQINSLQTSLGVYRAAETYHGKHGYSLRLDGLSKGLNDNARARAIVIHGADYAHPKVIKQSGQLGRSWGCPALPSYLSARVIDAIKNGTFIYAFASQA
ncbi:hypothetical protein BZG13_08060 [Salinivibrio sp. ML323]|uniref:murein L,D-transpeptidase catalytic domain family protein n=2 Tax=Vibrionaceae TaxID=641 RepID=UPI0009844ACA|nr:murein L,D-transpeptidase catalytic domain family protein [Salinivibrio sp. ML323]OOE58013.1 hypothetical protein BZG13_08060 [Salinivibrio sp. ML323]